ncbi:MAG: alpha/beta hydrolase [Ferruginibacter sp.]
MKVQKKLAIAYARTKLNLLTLVHTRSAGKEAYRLFCTPLVRYTGKPGATFQSGQARSFQLNDQWIRGTECNPGGKKTLLILHGFSSSYHKFDHLAAAFVEKDYRVLAFDAPAHGVSDGKMVNALDYSNMIKEIMRLFGPVDFFIAHSFGGLALSLALEAVPHNASVKVVLIAPATETTTAMTDALKFLQVSNPRTKEALAQHIVTISGNGPEWFSIRRAIRNIQAKVLWIHDEEDFITPVSDVLKVQEDHPPHVEFYFTQGLGHQKIYRDAEVKEKIIKFLE